VSDSKQYFSYVMERTIYKDNLIDMLYMVVIVIKLSNTMLFPPVAKTLSKCLRVWQQVCERWAHRCLADI